MSANDDQLLHWGSTQGHILTGGGVLDALSRPGIDFNDEHLAHYWLKQKTTKQTIRKWLDSNKRSMSIVGAWNRPLFSGGWMESTEHDTESFNLQTPSIFIDMRIPKLRPTAHLAGRRDISSCSDYELRLLARQHCFSGYSFPEPDKSVEQSGAQVFTRHHIVDWNYHPSFPRSRPNRWWVETQSSQNGEATESFKEFSTARDKYNNPVYMERWARREPKSGQQGKYLALRKVRTCPAILKAQGLPSQRDSLLILVGRHWCLAIDRDYTSLDMHTAALQVLQSSLGAAFVPTAARGGGPVYVDSLLGGGEVSGSGASLEYALRRRVAEDYVSLEGSYGVLPDLAVLQKARVASNTRESHFVVQRSTIPWLEGSSLPLPAARLQYRPDGTVQSVVVLGGSGDGDVGSSGGASSHALSANNEDKMQSRLLGEWEVLECSYTAEELSAIFNVRGGDSKHTLKSRL